MVIKRNEEIKQVTRGMFVESKTLNHKSKH